RLTRPHVPATHRAERFRGPALRTPVAHRRLARGDGDRAPVDQRVQRGRDAGAVLAAMAVAEARRRKLRGDSKADRPARAGPAQRRLGRWHAGQPTEVRELSKWVAG